MYKHIQEPIKANGKTSIEVPIFDMEGDKIGTDKVFYEFEELIDDNGHHFEAFILNHLLFCEVEDVYQMIKEMHGVKRIDKFNYKM